MKKDISSSLVHRDSLIAELQQLRGGGGAGLPARKLTCMECGRYYFPLNFSLP